MTLSINNIDLQWRNEDVRSLFTPFGEVASVNVAIDVFTESSRGYALIDMPHEQEAVKAIAALHNTEVKGRVIEVKPEQEKPQQKGSYKVGNGAVSAYKFKK
ncbi:MAG TPA: RNA-binding protein [Flavisolibacter sp.]|jgi:RNA recognition motif-containing protein|nr:RNA-binding protein [Flavisolibacter sp.]